MKVDAVTIFLEARLYKDDSGTYYSPDTMGTAFWMRYLDVFDQVIIAARVAGTNDIPAGSVEVKHEKITVAEITNYLGMKAYLPVRKKVLRDVNKICSDANHIIFRMPGQLSNIAMKRATTLSKPYGVELIGDPADVLGSGGAGGMLSRVLANIFKKKTQYACQTAVATSYVTEYILQRSYPPKPNTPTFSYSSITLPASTILPAPRKFASNPDRPFRLVTVGSLAQPTKGVDTVLHALAIVKKEVPNIHLSVVGDGAIRPTLENLSKELGCEDLVTFHGNLENQRVFDTLDNSDLFVLATRGEGLPRVIIEAMARALPVVSTNVSGVPELVHQKYLVEPNDHESLAAKLAPLPADAQQLEQMSADNLQRAAKYESQLLQQERIKFYSAVKSATKG